MAPWHCAGHGVTGIYGPVSKNSFSLSPFFLGNVSTDREELPNRTNSMSFSCARKPALGDTDDRASTTRPRAAFNDRPCLFIRYATSTVGDLDTAAEQCKRMTPVSLRDAKAVSMNAVAASTT